MNKKNFFRRNKVLKINKSQAILACILFVINFQDGDGMYSQLREMQEA